MAAETGRDLPDATHQYFTYDADGKRATKADSDGLTQFIYQGRTC